VGPFAGFIFSEFLWLFAGVWRGDNRGVLETKYRVANASFAPGGYRRHMRHDLLCFAEKSVAKKSLAFPFPFLVSSRKNHLSFAAM
jgi:hypothetical protein